MMGMGEDGGNKRKHLFSTTSILRTLAGSVLLKRGKKDVRGKWKDVGEGKQGIREVRER